MRWPCLLDAILFNSAMGRLFGDEGSLIESFV